MAYGTDSTTQILVYGGTNSDYDKITEEARIAATDYVNSILDLEFEITENVPSAYHTATNLLAAGILAAAPEKPDPNGYWKKGEAILMKIRGDFSDVDTTKILLTERF